MTANDADVAATVRTVATDLLGSQRVPVMEFPTMGSEDWSYVLEQVPGAMAFLGACPPELDPDTAPPCHSNLAIFDEAAFPTGIATYAAVALNALRPTPN